MPGFIGNVAQALRKYPQYQQIEWRGVPTGESQYHALEVVLERRFSRGLQFRVGYTYSRLRNNGAESAQGDDGINAGVQNPADPLEWAERRRHAARVPDRLHVGNTRLAELHRCEEGAARRLEHQRHPAVRERPAVQHHDGATTSAASCSTTRSARTARRASMPWPTCGTSIPTPTNYFNPAAWTDPGPLQFGNAPRNDGTVRWFPIYSEDLNLFKEFLLKGTSKIRFEAMFGNIFNRTLFCDPEHELERRQLRHGQHAVQPAAVDPAGVAVRLLTDKANRRLEEEPGPRGGIRAIGGPFMPPLPHFLVLRFLAVLLALPPISAPDSQAALQKAAALVQQGRLDEADQQAQLALADPETRAAAYSVLGTIRLQQQRLGESAALFQKAIELEPRLVGARLNLAQVYSLQGKRGARAGRCLDARCWQMRSREHGRRGSGLARAELAPRSTSADGRSCWTVTGRSAARSREAQCRPPPSSSRSCCSRAAPSPKAIGVLEHARDSYASVLRAGLQPRQRVRRERRRGASARRLRRRAGARARIGRRRCEQAAALAERQGELERSLSYWIRAGSSSRTIRTTCSASGASA